MEILTLLKANIRHKKGSFVSIIILMLIVSMSFTAVFSIKDNCINGINEAHEYINSSDLTVLIDNQLLTDDLLTSIEEHSSVEDVKVKEAVLTFGSEYGESKNVNPGLLEKYSEEYRLLNDRLTGYEENVPELKKGEIYVSQGVGTKLRCDIGDSIKIKTVGGEEYFTIKGFVVEPVWGSMNMGIKEMFISDEDFLRLQQEAVNVTDSQQADFRVVQVYKADESLGDGQFKHQLNEDTGIVKYSFFVLTKEQSIDYTYLMPDMILSGLLIFVGFLVVIVLIVMAHSITTSIEMEYKTLGVLKAQGFTEVKIRVILGAQYLVAEIIGAVLGVVAAFPMIKFFGNIFQPFLAVICENNISWGISVLFVAAMLIVSTIFIFFVTRKVGKVSPMKAISGGNEDVYFGSRLNASVSKKALSASLAFRQFTSNKKRYIGTVLIVALLTFFMITMSILGVSIDSKSAMESMGMGPMELRLQANESLTEDTVKDIEKIIENKTKIERRYFYDNYQMLINGNEYLSNIYKNPEFILLEEGRAPKYDNEIAVTDFLSKELNLKIGDKVTISRQNYEYEYLITGINIYANELGLNFSMPLEGAKKLGIEDTLFYGYSLADETLCNELAEEINEKYSDILTVKAYEADPNLEMYSSIIGAMTAVIYVVSVVFSLVVVMMFCKKAFLQERRDIGIYKSLGFTSAKLRLQFAVRFLIVSLIGSAFGSVLSLLFTEKLLTVVFKMVGISSFNSQFTPMAFIIPIAIIAVSFFVFSYMASSKIKKVEIKELVVE